ncbi:hypothetical protein OTB20_10970 [Streptomyces sp. H27-H1]|uniref:hypothetical protein n=1 Tax=Streptomyces sp. H27-H1 TaxID=2996461 RepID=UPI00226F5EEE|nr:hypothetical protein [Streptomyces sp. H27-H1]MCY0926717.1 hypothetical protein [Streptomyces sp. H27-H1]
MAASAQPHGGISGREIERACDIGPPIEYEWCAVFVVLSDSNAADVVVGAVGGLQPAETQPAFPRVQSGKQTGLFSDHDIPLQARLKPATGRAERAMHGAFGQFAQFVEARVEIRDELLLIPEFLG